MANNILMSRWVRGLVVCQLVLVVLIFPLQVHATPPSSEEPLRPRIGLVPSGGGALGYAHIGVLRVLEEMRVPIDCIVGTSMGALVGGVYAAGVSPMQMQNSITSTDIGAFFDDNPPRADIAQNIKRDDFKPLFEFSLGPNHGKLQLPFGTSAGYKFELFLKELIGLRASLSNTKFVRCRHAIHRFVDRTECAYITGNTDGG